MSKPMITIHNTETDEIIQREMNEIELTAFNAATEKKVEEEAAKAALEAKKQEVLAKLGLTADEVSALLA